MEHQISRILALKVFKNMYTASTKLNSTQLLTLLILYSYIQTDIHRLFMKETSTLRGGGVQAYHFGKKDFELGVGGEGQDTSRNFGGSFGSIRALLPMRGLGEKTGTKTKIWTNGNRA